MKTEQDRQLDRVVSKIVFEDGPPRFKGCPPICEAENLPAFRTQQLAEEFNEKRAPGNRIERIWLCPKCEHWHYVSKLRPPSGDTSGTSRRRLKL
jgi:hypothetical protein